ncbi:MAG: S-layer homology domain-containing protein [Armatimonadota bacterium]
MSRLAGLCCLLGALLACSTLPAMAAAELPICLAPDSIQSDPAADGARVVWADWRVDNPDLPPTGPDIYLYDLATGLETPICLAAGDQVYPAIDGDRIVWRDKRSGSWEIYLHDLSTAVTRKIASAPTTRLFDARGPDISGNIVVWADERSHPTSHKLDVFMYDLSTDTLTQLTNVDTDQGIGSPRVDGNRIVWCDTRSDPAGDIAMYDLDLHQESFVASWPGTEAQPDICGTDLVYTRGAGEGIWNICHRDLSSAEEPTPLAPVAAPQFRPLVAGRWVTWSDFRNGDTVTGLSQVYVYDLQLGQLHPMTRPFGDYPALSAAGLVAWTDWRNGNRAIYENPDIYGYVLTRFWDVLANQWAYEAIEACVAAGVVSGYPEGDYKPGDPVTRDQMAVYISRALAGGDSNVPPFTDTPTFPDVDEDHWALRHVEYAVEQGVVTGFEDGTYQPQLRVDRGQMAVYIARAIATPTGEAGLVGYEPPAAATFPDVPTNFWAYKHVEYCVEHGVVQGYGDGWYYPGNVVTRDQMAVYVKRAFNLPS